MAVFRSFYQCPLLCCSWYENGTVQATINYYPHKHTFPEGARWRYSTASKCKFVSCFNSQGLKGFLNNTQTYLRLAPAPSATKCKKKNTQLSQ
jgi:hypothetical protein